MNCLVTQAAQRFGDSPALVDSTHTITYLQFDQLVAQTAHRLTELGITKETRVGILLPNSREQITLLIALIRLGAVACPISTRLPQQAVAGCLKKVDASILITDENVEVDNCRIIRLSEVIASEPTKPHHIGELSPDQPAVIIFTSGSTGEPKAVLLTLGNLYYNALGSNENISFGPGDRWLLSLPLYHVGGLGILFRAIVGGGAVVIGAQDADLGDTILRQEITHLSLVSTQLHRLLPEVEKRALSQRRLKAILLGGSGMPSEMLRRSVECNLPIHTSYGLSEMASQVTTTPPGASLEQLHTSGRLLPHRQMRIADSGEIEVRGETRFAGYVERGELVTPFDADGWFATGDIGSVDCKGFLTVIGRRDTMFISGGENIYPEEIEKALLHIAGVDEAVVVAVAHDAYGFRPCAFVRAAQSFDLTPDQIRTELRNSLPAFKLPDRIFPWPEGAASSGLKPDRQSLQQLAQRLTATHH